MCFSWYIKDMDLDYIKILNTYTHLTHYVEYLKHFVHDYRKTLFIVENTQV